MTIAPRLEVFTQLSCNAVHGHQPIDYNHTRARELFTLTPHSLDSAGDSAPELLFHSLEDSEGDDGDGDDDDDPLRIPTKRCISDPAVQAGAARLQTIMTTTMGLLSALTTGWWGHFGERHGRTRVLAVATLGLLLTDLIFVLVSLPGSPLAAHGHKLLIIAPVVEGLLGGWSTLQGAASAYVSDCTSDGSRAHIFSRFMGVFYFGFALGPMLGAWFIAHPPPLAFLLPASEARSAGHTVTPVFWVAVMFALVNFFLALFVFPESLGKEKREARRVAEAAAAVELEVQGSKSSNGGVLALVKGLLVPLMMFAPKKRATKKDWNMTFLALALFGYLLSSGIFSLKYLYAEHVFGWEAEQLSYYITLVGGARAVHLLFIMPFIIAVCKPKPKAAAAAQQSSAPAGKKPKPTKAQVAAEMMFDLRISRISYAVDLLSHTLVALSSTAPTAAAQAAFVCFTLLSCFGSGIVPSVQSLALCIVQADAMEDERLGTISSSAGAATGSLFGAFAVLQATGQMVLGPMIFGLVYSTTVARFPKGIFALAASILVVSLALLMLVQPRLGGALEQKKPRKGSSRAWAEPEMERGRSRISKDLTGGVADGSPGSSSGSVPKDGWASTSY
ncbi:MFS general substrate transporter [Phellopilus nigrolimitatus]|nr:MFS general substrate transporter [Phellopilus nigrolimitatus]